MRPRACATGKVTRIPTNDITTYRIKYSDNQSVGCAEEELRNCIDDLNFPEWSTAVASVKEAYTYLENRITDNCQTPYHCSAPYEVCRVSQLFDPSFAVDNLASNFIDELCDAIPALRDAAAALKSELDAYRVAARTCPTLDYGDVAAFILKAYSSFGASVAA